MTTIQTKFTRLLNVRTPVVSAAMAGASGGLLAARVTAAGGFGFMSPGKLKGIFQSQLEIARNILATPPDDALNIGVGYICWKLDEDSDAGEEMVKLALAERVSAIWFSFGNDLGRWINFVRRYDQDRQAPHKTLIFVLVNSVHEAQRVVHQWKVDVLIAQGIEAGGHGAANALPLLTLLTEVLHEFPDTPPVLAAGGLSTGAQAAALLTLGASGIVLGTRFLLTPEALYNSAQKSALLIAHATSTVRTTAFDEVRNTLGWPSGVDGRALKNQTVKDVEAGMTIGQVKERFTEAVKKGDPNGMVVWAGTGVGMMNEIKDAKDIVQEVHDDIAKYIQAAHSSIKAD